MPSAAGEALHRLPPTVPAFCADRPDLARGSAEPVEPRRQRGDGDIVQRVSAPEPHGALNDRDAAQLVSPSISTTDRAKGRPTWSGKDRLPPASTRAPAPFMSPPLRRSARVFDRSQVCRRHGPSPSMDRPPGLHHLPLGRRRGFRPGPAELSSSLSTDALVSRGIDPSVKLDDPHRAIGPFHL
jgi:hypothetical protein